MAESPLISESRVHAAAVDAWLEQRARRSASAADVGGFLLEALRAMWSRTRTTLGDITLAAIFNRVLTTARQESPVLATIGLRVTEDFALEVDTAALRDVGRAEMTAASRALMVELLAVVGRLTGGTMTPALHASLAASGTDTTPTLSNLVGKDRGTR